MTVTLERSRRSWASWRAAPAAAASPAWDMATCSSSAGSNSGMGSFHRCFCKSRVLRQIGPSHQFSYLLIQTVAVYDGEQKVSFLDALQATQNKHYSRLCAVIVEARPQLAHPIR